MSIETTRQLQGDEVVSKTDADNTYLTLNNDTIQQVQGPVNFVNITINNERVLTERDVVDTSQFVTVNTPQTITSTKTFDIDTNIASGRKLIFKGNRDGYLTNHNGFLNVGDAWGIYFNRSRGANATAVLQDHIETPYINIGSGSTSRYKLAKSGDNLTWDGKIVVTQSQLYTMFSRFATVCGVENSDTVRSILEELGE